MSIKVTPDLIIEIDYDPYEVIWPYSGVDEEGEIDQFYFNHDFAPIDNHFSLEKIMQICKEEVEKIALIASGDSTFQEVSDEVESMYGEGGWWECPWAYLDLGVWGPVLAVKAIGGVPISSCNGGCFSDDNQRHQYDYPMFSFRGNEGCISSVERSARRTGCGIFGSDGCLIVYTNDIRNFAEFAMDLLS